MKIYFMKGTDEQVQFGEFINVHQVEEEDGGVVHKAFCGKFDPSVVDFLLEKEIIEEKEVEDPEPDFVDPDDVINEIIQEQVNLSEEIENLKREIAILKESIAKFKAKKK
jgi:hypothetical protein